MRKEINRKLLKKGQKKLSTRLNDKVIMRERMEYKGHHHVKKSQAFCEGRTISELALTPLRRTLTKSWLELILGHSPQMLTTRTVKKLYPRNLKHICNKLRCDRNARISNVSKEERYWTINPVHVGVKLLDKYERTCDRDLTQWLPSSTVNDSGKVGVGEVCQNDLAFRMNAAFRNILWECLVGIIIIEPKRERSRIRRRRGTRMKRVLGRSGLTLRCHRHN